MALLIAGLMVTGAVEVTVQNAWAGVPIVVMVVVVMIMLGLSPDDMSKGHVIIMCRIGCEAGPSGHKDRDNHHDLTQPNTVLCAHTSSQSQTSRWSQV